LYISSFTPLPQGSVNQTLAQKVATLAQTQKQRFDMGKQALLPGQKQHTGRAKHR